MKLDKIIIALALLIISGGSVFADNVAPIVTERKKIEKQEISNDNIEKATPQQQVENPKVQVPKVTPKAPINNQYQKPKMGVSIYSKNRPASSRSGKPVCNKCKYPKRTRGFLTDDSFYGNVKK